ncbi:beta-phosphoglucomutase family hydrolase [Vibrio sp. 03-59-1]|uniref:beta-phosphoglucomutase family hydrolase n=1 Tax=Vibrio TaxID=662 RepID=UPI0014933C37|nr:beta-phosphoglucomutase family hydrolase [Vibrio sp. 03-59-1]NOH82200.1 beta-phosphoglucomutase family hydrolase [Vibrio sp. 03-59-1]
MSIDLSSYQGLIFDMDGTLIDTMPAHLDAWEKTANQFEFPFDMDWLHSLGGMPSFKIIGQVNQKYGLNLDAKQVSKFKMQSFAALEHHGEVIECTYQILLDNLGKKKLAVGTGSQRESATRLLKKAQLLDRLDAMVSATDVDNHKPAPDTFLQAAKELALGSTQCVVFEDTHLGKMAAHAAGMDCYLVVDGRLEFHPVSQATD